MDPLNTLIFISLGFVIGAVSSWLISRSRIHLAAEKVRAQSQAEISTANERVASKDEALRKSEQDLATLSQTLDRSRTALTEATTSGARLAASLEAEIK